MMMDMRPETKAAEKILATIRFCVRLYLSLHMTVKSGSPQFFRLYWIRKLTDSEG
jgi:hypothetical protein